MKKRYLLLATALVVVIGLALVVPVLACGYGDCQYGCTPGYWKQPHHLDSWVATGYSPYQSFNSAFGVGPTDMTLLDALWLKGGGENAFMRHAVAALLNAAHPQLGYWEEWRILKVAHDYWGQEWAKDWFQESNEWGCPLN